MKPASRRVLALDVKSPNRSLAPSALIAGNAADQPILDTEFHLDWRTCEYWSPHVAFYLWANSVLEG